MPDKSILDVLQKPKKEPYQPKTGFGRYLQGSVDALGRIPADVGKILSDPLGEGLSALGAMQPYSPAGEAAYTTYKAGQSILKGLTEAAQGQEKMASVIKNLADDIKWGRVDAQTLANGGLEAFAQTHDIPVQHLAASLAKSGVPVDRIVGMHRVQGKSTLGTFLPLENKVQRALLGARDPKQMTGAERWEQVRENAERAFDEAGNWIAPNKRVR